MDISRIGWRDALGRMQTVTSALALAAIFTLQGPAAEIFAISSAEAKTPGKTYCFYGHCHRVRTIEETKRAIGVHSTIKVSYYDDPKRDRYNPSNVTSSGEYFRSDKPDNAASPIWPDGTRMLLWNPANKHTAVVRINNAGPYWGQRQLDVSRATAEKLGFVKSGVATLQTRVVAAPTPAEATYRKGRQYTPVPGFLGVFETIDTALLKVGRSIHNIFTSPVQAVAGRDAPEAAKPVRVAEAKSAPATRSAAKPEPKAVHTPEPKAVHMAEPKVVQPTEPKAVHPVEPKPDATVAKAEPTPEVKVAKAEPKPEAKVAKADIKPAVKLVKAEPRPEPKVVKLEPKAEPKVAKPVVKVAKVEPRPAPAVTPKPQAQSLAQSPPLPKIGKSEAKPEIKVARAETRTQSQGRGSSIGPQPQDLEQLGQFGARSLASRPAVAQYDDDDDDDRPVRRRAARSRAAD